MRREALSIIILLGLTVPVWAGFDEGLATDQRGE
jgi:hypothetical protein